MYFDLRYQELHRHFFYLRGRFFWAVESVFLDPSSIFSISPQVAIAKYPWQWELYKKVYLWNIFAQVHSKSPTHANQRFAGSERWISSYYTQHHRKAIRHSGYHTFSNCHIHIYPSSYLPRQSLLAPFALYSTSTACCPPRLPSDLSTTYPKAVQNLGVSEHQWFHRRWAVQMGMEGGRC